MVLAGLAERRRFTAVKIGGDQRQARAKRAKVIAAAQGRKKPGQLYVHLRVGKNTGRKRWSQGFQRIEP